MSVDFLVGPTTKDPLLENFFKKNLNTFNSSRVHKNFKFKPWIKLV